MKSELEILREQNAKHEAEIIEWEKEAESLRDRIFELECDLEDAQDTKLDTSTIDKLMMFEKLKENWHLLKMDDIQAICKL